MRVETDRTPYYENSFVLSKVKTKRQTFNNTHSITENKMLPDSLRPVEQPFGLACFNNNQFWQAGNICQGKWGLVGLHNCFRLVKPGNSFPKRQVMYIFFIVIIIINFDNNNYFNNNYRATNNNNNNYNNNDSWNKNDGNNHPNMSTPFTTCTDYCLPCWTDLHSLHPGTVVL